MINPRIAVFHGPNLNLLGTREPQVYGKVTLEDIDKMLEDQAEQASVDIVCRQSNSESELIDWIQQSTNVNFIIINPAAYTHTSVGLRDALSAIGIPFIEVHLSNVHAREAFRRHSYFSDIATAVITGLGYRGYGYALDFAVNYINSKDN